METEAQPETSEPAPQPKPKPLLSRSQRRNKLHRQTMRENVALNELVDRLLELLEEATRPTATPHERVRLRRIMTNIKATLAKPERPAPKPDAAAA